MKLKNDYIKLDPKSRLYHSDIPIIGLTGGIATGKSTVAKILKKLGHPIIDADALVKEVYKTEQAISYIKSRYPDVFEKEKINFPKLRKVFFNDSHAQARIEDFIYKLLPTAFELALDAMPESNYIIYDVPLLFEKQIEKKVDISICVYIPEETQKQRLKERDQINDELIETILKSQMNIEEKKKKADFVIENTKDLDFLSEQVDRLCEEIFISD